ncbi:MAG: hypothetical protein GY703_22660 [Gammaproteobacteria bacterium]|nr:hypothetical protein [Gammaproteobacteria bacterium]
MTKTIRYPENHLLCQAPGSIFAMLLLFLLAGCASVEETTPETSATYLERAQTQSKGPIRVTASVPSAKETRELFGAPLYLRDIQPVLLTIENQGPSTLNFLPVGVDPLYFTPMETAFLSKKSSKGVSDQARARQFYNEGMGAVSVLPGETRTGFVFTSLDEGTKTFNVDLLSERDKIHSFTFFIPVPGLRIDHHNVDWENLYPADEWLEFDESAALIEALKNFPCCTTDKKSRDQGDPLNLVIIGDIEDVYYAFLRAGWDETETIHAGSLQKTIASFFSGGEYRYSPISGLYVFGRPQDVAFQKTRDNIHERNHLRLWLSPVRYQNVPVFIGQISRDIGVRFSKWTITTHEIDPDVDETREFLLENLAYSQTLTAIAYVDGVGKATMEAPRKNLTDSPYFTDGRRVVLWITATPTSIADIKVVEWRDPTDN